MATIYKQLQAAGTVTLLSTELNGLATSATATSSVVNGTGIVQSLAGGGTTNMDGYTTGLFKLSLASQTNAISAGAINVWFLRSQDGTNFESGNPPPRLPNLTFYPSATNAAQLLFDEKPLPVGYFKILIQPANLGASSQLAATGNTLVLLASTTEQV